MSEYSTKGISGLLEKFRHILASSVEVEKVIMEEIQVVSKINLEKKEFVLRDNQVYLKTSPVKRSEIFLRKEKILLAINEKLPVKNKIKDIK